MGLTRKPKKGATSYPKNDLMTEMVKLMGQMLVQNQEFLKAQQEWLKLFKPPEQPVKSTTAEERESMKAESGMWDSVEASEMLKELGLGPSDDGDGIM